MRTSSAGADSMTPSGDEIEVIARSRVARVATYFFVAALLISGLIFKLQPGGSFASDMTALTGVAFVLAFFAIAFVAFYAIYLAVEAIRTGQFPAVGACVPVSCKVTRGYKAKISICLAALSGFGLFAFAALIARSAFLSWW